MQLDTTFLLQLISTSGAGRTLFALLYGDPGSGTLVWQLLLAAVFGLMFYVRHYTRRIRDAVRARGVEAKANEAASLSSQATDAASVEPPEHAPVEQPRTML